METVKNIIPREEWDFDLNIVKIEKAKMNRIVMNLLVAEGYKDAAEKFQIESRTDQQLDLVSINERLAVVKDIESKNLDDATEKLNALDPEILKTNFHLLQQMLIELIRKDKIEDAIVFSQEKLAPLAQENDTFARELEKTIGILVTEGLSNFPSKDLFDDSQWIKTAMNVNAEIHTSQTGKKGPKLERLFKKLIWIQNKLDENTVHEYPHMSDLSTCELIYPPE